MGNIVNFYPGSAWQGLLSRSDGGVVHPIVANALIVMGHDEALVGLIAYDDFAHRIVITRHPPVPYQGEQTLPGPYPRAVTDTDVTMMQGHMQRAYGMKLTQLVAQQAMTASAEMNRIHPVREWLDALEWDGVPRIETWLSVAFGCPQDRYHEAIGTKVLCAAVRRVRQPGCKFDYVLVLEGKQGRGKSRACAALFGPAWFTDNLSHDLANKDAQQGMSGKWGLELAELNVLVRSSTSQAAKAFFSRQVDYYRPPYGRSFVERPRQCVFIGTTNDSDYLTDSTGNRRYWPVFCEKAEVAWIAEVREQLWAEAAAIEAQGEALWLDDETLHGRAVTHQADRMAEDVWTIAIRAHIQGDLGQPLGEVRVPDLLHHALNLPRAQQNRGAEMRVASILKADGWMRHRYRPAGREPIVAWFAPGCTLPGVSPPRTVPTRECDAL